MKYETFEPAYYYHVYNRGNNKELIFKEEENYNYFLVLVKKYLLPICNIYGYCLLPNHFHLIIKIKDFDDLSEKIKNGKSKVHQPFSNLFNAYTKAINKKYQRNGSLFQEHLKRIKIDNEDYLRSIIVYVNTNPSHHNICGFEKYRHSSYKSLLSDKTTLLKRNEVISLFEDKENFEVVHKLKEIKITDYKKFIFETDET